MRLNEEVRPGGFLIRVMLKGKDEAALNSQLQASFLGHQ